MADRSKRNHHPNSDYIKTILQIVISLKKQKVMSQKKGQDKTPVKLNEVEIGNLPEKEFRIITVKMIQDLWKTMKKMQKCLPNN